MNYRRGEDNALICVDEKAAPRVALVGKRLVPVNRIEV
jgi:hypothetical protein